MFQGGILEDAMAFALREQNVLREFIIQWEKNQQFPWDGLSSPKE